MPMEPTAAAETVESSTDGTGAAATEDVLVEDVLVEEISIDGMCGVY